MATGDISGALNKICLSETIRNQPPSNTVINLFKTTQIMISYSLVRRGVNANLLDINFAKSRIKAS